MNEIKINYNNTIPEIKRAYSLFRRKYAIKRMLPMTIAFSIAIVLGANMVWLNPTGIAGIILTAMSAGLLISMWTRPVLAQKKLIQTIEAMGEERYEARFYDDRVEVDTEILPDTETETVAISRHGVDVVKNPEILEKAEENLIQSETSVIGVATEELFSVEDSEIFCLFVNRALIYIFPKRCLSEEQTAQLRKYFDDKGI